MTVEGATVCMANIGPSERGVRMKKGLFVLAIFFACAAYMIWFVDNRWYRVVLAVPMVMAALGIFQSREHTCVFLAAKGHINLDNGESESRDPEFVSRTIEQAQRVWVKSILATILVIVALLTLPVA